MFLSKLPSNHPLVWDTQKAARPTAAVRMQEINICQLIPNANYVWKKRILKIAILYQNLYMHG